MHLIIGGKYQGKKLYAYELYNNFPKIYELNHDDPKSINSPGLITNIHLGVKRLLLENEEPCGFFMSILETLRECVIIGDEICGGVVPVDSFERRWLDETGRLYQLLAHEADVVDRVFAGLALRLKGGGWAGGWTRRYTKRTSLTHAPEVNAHDVQKQQTHEH